jgi:hemolysin activation/secretion protein
VSAQIERPFGDRRLVLQSVIGAVGATPDVPPQEHIFLGGPTTGPGYAFHQFVGTFGASQRVEWRTPVPFVSIPLGRFGRAPATATLAPFVQGVYVNHAAPFARRAQGWYPSLGVGALILYDALRIDVARGLRDARWTFSLDVMRDLWGIL